MAQKKALTDEELLAQFEGIGTTTTTTTTTTSSSAPKPPSKASKPTVATTPLADDPLAELESLAKAKPPSRPHTPKLAAVGRRDAATPTSTSSARNSGDTSRPVAPPPRKSAESTRSFHQGLTPTSEEAATAEEAESPKQATTTTAGKGVEGGVEGGAGGGRWWGGLFATATAAVKQAEAAVREIQKNEEAQKWVEQVRGNVGVLNKLGDDLRTRALPTFNTIINTLAPPISQHERLQIHVTHDLVGYPSLDPTIHQVFTRVMLQVEGGELLVLHRSGSASSSRRPSLPASANPGWADGPWWRDGRQKRSLNIVQGQREATKLCRASAEACARELFSRREGGIEAATRRAAEVANQDHPVRTSDIFIALQAVGFEGDSLFEGSVEPEPGLGLMEEKRPDELVAFAIYLHDPVHSIDFGTLTQPFPRKWADWLDAENVPTGEMQLPEEIVDIVKAGGVDPREWVSEWLEEILSLGVGVVAQRYVARRMGVGEGGIGRGKARDATVEAGAGEAARAGMI